MKILTDFPPNFGDISTMFPLTGKEIFCWGDTIYNPSGEKLAIQIIEHEKVHSDQQGDLIQDWWDRYLLDKEFRLYQELDAHRIEYKVYSELQPNRNMRRVYLSAIAKRLSSPMYGRMVSFDKAKRLIRKK